MHIVEFLQALENQQFLEQYATIIWRAEEYSALFFSRLFTVLKTHKKVPLLYFSVPDSSWQEAQSQLSTLFLGNKQYYWFADFSQADTQTRDRWLGFVQNYSGPHTLLLYIPKTSDIPKRDTQLIVDIPQFVSAELFKRLYSQLYSFGAAVDPNFTHKLFATQKNIILEDACRIMSYYQVLGKRYETFFDSWLEKLRAPEKSLFTLSQHLFAQDKTQFQLFWSSIRTDYPPEYWVSFWSEQIMQALVYISIAETRSALEAKKHVHRLPFSFMNKDWKKFNTQFLTKAHDMLYVCDYSLKNGGEDWGIELWCQKFLHHQF